jgi:tetratricopeptide (TPR) repeat protein
MNRAARRKQRTPRARRSPTGQPSKQASVKKDRKRLVALLGVGVVLVGVATWIRFQTESNPLLRIPPVETRDVLPAVAKEIRLRQDEILAAPDSAEAWGMYGLVLLAHDFREQAAACFAEAERLADDDYRWPYYYGMTMGTSDVQQSLQAFRRAAEKGPGQVAVRMRLAEWLFDLRDLEASERAARAALELDPDNPRAQLLIARLHFQTGDIEDSLAWAQRAADSPKGNRRDVHELLARLHTRLGDRDAAAREVGRAEALPPGVAVWDDPEMGRGGIMMRDASILNSLAAIHKARGETEQWLKMLRQVVEKEPNNVRAKENLAQALLEAQRYQEAGTFIDVTLKEYPGFSQFECLRGQVDMVAGDVDAACRRFQRATELKPDYAEAFMWWGRSLLAQKDYPAAIAALREAIRLSPSLANAYDSLSQALLTTGQVEEAVREAKRATAVQPGNVQFRLHLAQALVAAKRVAEARPLLQNLTDDADAPKEARVLLEQIGRQANGG